MMETALNLSIATSPVISTATNNSKSFIPKSAIVLHYNEAKDCTVPTLHSVKNGELDIGKEVSFNDLLDCFQSHHIAATDNTFNNNVALLSERILLDTSEHLVFYTKSQKRRLWQGMGEKLAYEFYYPATLFAINKPSRHLAVFALAYNRRPKITDRLYALPIPNIYESGSVCQGTAQLPMTLTSTNLAEIADSFFNGVKTHLNCDNTFRKKYNARNKQSGYEKWLKQHCDTKPKMSELECRGTLNTVLQRLLAK
ncbi:hypothetical protein [Photobacterium angustum]|nr:hypothetical protein [Photobacterium angustum]